MIFASGKVVHFYIGTGLQLQKNKMKKKYFSSDLQGIYVAKISDSEREILENDSLFVMSAARFVGNQSKNNVHSKQKYMR